MFDAGMSRSVAAEVDLGIDVAGDFGDYWFVVDLQGYDQNTGIKRGEKLEKNEKKEYWATFSSLKLNFAEEKFEGAKMDATFGSIVCDLREAEIAEGALIKACSVFGAITILAPKDIDVKVVSNGLFGGATDRYRNKRMAGEKKRTLYVDATCVFGGVEVK